MTPQFPTAAVVAAVAVAITAGYMDRNKTHFIIGFIQRKKTWRMPRTVF